MRSEFILLSLVHYIVNSRHGKTNASRNSIPFNVVYHPPQPNDPYSEMRDFFSNQSKLISHLFEGYNRNIPAVYTRERYGGESRPLRCNTTLYYLKLLSIDEPKQCAQMIIDLIYSYVDPRLSWNPDDFDGIQEITIAKKDTVWFPDVFPYDIMTYTESVPEDRQSVNIYFNGTLKFYSTAVADFICHLRLSNFPFDDQTCEYRLTSFNLPRHELNGNGEWQFRGVSVENDWYPGQFDHEYSMVKFAIQFRRSTTYYFTLIIIPSFILTLLCLSGLFWNSLDSENYMENLNLGLTAILAMMLILQMSTENIPKIGEINLLSRYSMINLFLIALAILANMGIGKLKIYKTRRELKKELDAGPATSQSNGSQLMPIVTSPHFRSDSHSKNFHNVEIKLEWGRDSKYVADMARQYKPNEQSVEQSVLFNDDMSYNPYGHGGYGGYPAPGGYYPPHNEIHHVHHESHHDHHHHEPHHHYEHHHEHHYEHHHGHHGHHHHHH